MAGMVSIGTTYSMATYARQCGNTLILNRLKSAFNWARQPSLEIQRLLGSPETQALEQWRRQ